MNHLKLASRGMKDRHCFTFIAIVSIALFLKYNVVVSVPDFMSSAHSKLQLSVLSLYKQFLRATADQPSLQTHVRETFRENAQKFKKSDVFLIEYHLRKGTHQLKMLKDSSVVGFHKVDMSDRNSH